MTAGRMRSIVVGYGVQGRKRRAIAGRDVVAVVDPAVDAADCKDIREVPLDSFDAAQVCTPLPLHCVWPGAHTRLFRSNAFCQAARLDVSPSLAPSSASQA